jgi:hypothetical protein
MKRHDENDGLTKAQLASKERARQREELKAAKGWRVVYGETMPAWEKIFPTKREANAFAKRHEKMGDVVFSVKKVVPGEPPQSFMGRLA